MVILKLDVTEAEDNGVKQTLIWRFVSVYIRSRNKSKLKATKLGLRTNREERCTANAAVAAAAASLNDDSSQNRRFRSRRGLKVPALVLSTKFTSYTKLTHSCFQ